MSTVVVMVKTIHMQQNILAMDIFFCEVVFSLVIFNYYQFKFIIKFMLNIFNQKQKHRLIFFYLIIIVSIVIIFIWEFFLLNNEKFQDKTKKLYNNCIFVEVFKLT